VALLHLSETTILAARLRAWIALLWSGPLLVATVVLLVWRIALDVSHGVRFADLLVVASRAALTGSRRAVGSRGALVDSTVYREAS
jgi:CRISPR-associated DxTHG motif protein